MDLDQRGGLIIMNRTGNVRLFLGEGEFDFALLMGELMELEQLTGDGVMLTHTKLVTGAWKVVDILHTLRLGLIGGGMAKQAAYDLVNRHVKPGYLHECALVASAVAAAAVVGVPGEGDDTGEQAGETVTQTVSPTGDSHGDGSSPPPPPEASASET